MLREVSIIIFTVCCVFSIIPLAWISFPNPSAPLLGFILLGIVLFYAAYDIVRLFQKKEGEFALTFLLILIATVVFSLIILFTFGIHLMPKAYS